MTHKELFLTFCGKYEIKEPKGLEVAFDPPREYIENAARYILNLNNLKVEKEYLACVLQIWKAFDFERQIILLPNGFDLINNIISSNKKLKARVLEVNPEEIKIDNLSVFRKLSMPYKGILTNVSGFIYSPVEEKDLSLVKLYASMCSISNALGIII